MCAGGGLRFGREPNYVRGRRTSVRGRTELCARKTVILWTIIYVINVGMIQVYRLKCDSLEMFSVYKCIDVLRMYLYVGLSATSLEMFSMARGAI